MKSIHLGSLIVFVIFSVSLSAQDTLRLSKKESEAVFLNENLLLLAENLNISKEEAKLHQARLWPNPQFEADEINLWATKRQLAVFGDELKGFGSSSTGKNLQLAFSLEQLIQTAGKRKKLMKIHEVSIEQAGEYFEDLLRNLKLEFRKQLTQLQYLQAFEKTYQHQLESVSQLISSYQNQLEGGHIPKSEFIRLKAFELEIKKENHDLKQEIDEVQNELKLLMNLPASSYLEIIQDDFSIDPSDLKLLSIPDLEQTAETSRPDFRLADLERTFSDRVLDYEKSLRIPDLTLKAGYDRGGNFMYNFIGFGFSVDLPVFDRNQGAVKAAAIERDQARLLYDQKRNELKNEISLAVKNLNRSLEFLKEIDPGYEEELEGMLRSYTKNFLNRNLGILEYLDFQDAYLENKKILYDAIKDGIDKREELRYVVGSELFE